MVGITKSKTFQYEANPKVVFDVQTPPPTINEVNSKRIKELVNNFNKDDAKAACEALVQNYPGMYFDVFIKEYAKKAATLEAIKTVMDKGVDV